MVTIYVTLEHCYLCVSAMGYLYHYRSDLYHFDQELYVVSLNIQDNGTQLFLK